MSKITALVVLGSVLVVGACAKHSPAPQPVVAAPVYMEPVSTKGK